MKNILLVQLGSNGDCLFVTTIARQIKETDYPGCHLTWMIASSYKHVLAGNPYIDEVLEIEAPTRETMIEQRARIPALIQQAGANRNFQHVFVTDFSNNSHNWFGTTRSCLFRNYPNRIRVDIRPDIFLTAEETEKVRIFCKAKDIRTDTVNILMESSPQSGQSKMTTEQAVSLASALCSKQPHLRIIISTKEGIEETVPGIIDGSSLTWRENAELINHCHLLVGCSSGISWLGTSRWCKTIPYIQNIDPQYWGKRMSASFIDDYLFFNTDASHIVELHNPSTAQMQICIEYFLQYGIEKTKQRYPSHPGAVFANTDFLKESYMSHKQKQHIKRVMFFKKMRWRAGDFVKRVQLYAGRKLQNV